MKILTKVPVADLGEGRPYFLLFMLAQGMDKPQSMFGSTKWYKKREKEVIKRNKPKIYNEATDYDSDEKKKEMYE